MSISQNFPSTRPSLNLNFARSQKLDPRITFTRTTTGTRVGPDGYIEVVPADQPRFDFDPISGESLGLLIEEQRTNLILYSNDFSQSSWTKQNSHPTPSKNAIGPDGVANSASTVYRTAINQYLYQVISGAGTYTLSAWVKSEAATGDFTMNAYNAIDGTIQTSFTATNEWQRFEITISVTINTNYYPCIPTNTNTNFYVWGVQVESGSFKTSYIPTEGSTATRNPDNVSITGQAFQDFYNQSEGSVRILAKTNMIYDGTNRFPYSMQIDDGTSSNRMAVDNAVLSTTIRHFLSVWADGSAIANDLYNLQNVNGLPCSFGYKTDDIAFVNGSGTLFTDDTAPIAKTMNRLVIGGGTGGPINGHISQLIYYPVRLSNDQLITLTK